MLGVNQPAALRSASSLMVRTTVMCFITFVATSIAMRSSATFVVPMLLSALFGHMTAGIALFLAARARYLSAPPRSNAGFFGLAGLHFAGALLTMFGALSTLSLCATIVAHG